MLSKKTTLIILLTAMVSLSTFSTDIYLPSLPEMTSFFNTTYARSQLTLSIYMLGFALSMLLCGPLADRFGRKPVVLGGISLHFFATICCIFAPSIELLIIARFFQAIGGCCGTVLGRVIARDLFNEKECVKVLSYLSTGLALSLTLAPILGGFLQTHFDWHSGFIVLAIVSSIIFISTFFLLNESLDSKKRQSSDFRTLINNFSKILKNRHFLGYTSAITFAWCGYFSFISGSSFIFINLMHITPQNYGMLYALMVIGYIAGTLLASRLANRWNARQAVFIGTVLTLGGGIAMIFQAFIFPLNAFSLMFPMLFYLLGTGLIMPNAQSVVTRPFPEMVGSASSLFYFIEMLFGALAGALVGMFQKNSQVPMVVIIALSSILLFASFYQLIWKKNVFAENK